MALLGYARVSTNEQDLSVQIDALKKAGCEVVRSEKFTGKNFSDRTELNNVLDFSRSGDKIVVTSLCRLGRSFRHLVKIFDDLDRRNISLLILNHNIDTSTPMGKMMLNMLGIFSEFEWQLMRERQMAGIEAAKKKGKYLGRPKSITHEKKKMIMSMVECGASKSEISRKIRVSRASVYRTIDEHKVVSISEEREKRKVA